jgi:hypothetical protein
MKQSKFEGYSGGREIRRALKPTTFEGGHKRTVKA